MWIQLSLAVLCISSAWAECDHTISVEGVSTFYGNDVVNGLYEKMSFECNSRDVFNHTTEAIYLQHIDDGLFGYWIFRDYSTSCGDADIDNGYVRANDDEVNPGLVQLGWAEKIGTGNWESDNDIDVDCYDMPTCTYQIMGVTNTSLNGYYYTVDNMECQWRAVHKHEMLDVYLYFILSDKNDKYYWLVDEVACTDGVYSTALIQNDGYTLSPELIIDDWEERSSTGSYVVNSAIDVDCNNPAPPEVTTIPPPPTTAAPTPPPTTTSSSTNTGAVYVRWGRHGCDGAGFVYEGVMSAPGDRFNGSGANYLCLHVEPEWGTYMDGDDTTTAGRGVIYGVEYHGNPDEIFDNTNLIGTTFFEQNAPCAVCESVRETLLMIPGVKSCPGTWMMEYWGYLMSDNYNVGRTAYICMDHAPEARDGGSQPQVETSNIYHVEARCGSLPCPKYIDNREITCVVCSK